MIRLSNGDLIRTDAVKYLIGDVVGIECGSTSIRFRLENETDKLRIETALMAGGAAEPPRS